jgi:osmotically inducible lipoprotein OsmB
MSTAKSLKLLARMNSMNTKILISAAAASLIALTTLSGCGTNPTNAQIGTATGAVIGGVAGSAISGGSTLGTVGGAAAGALIGNEVGKKQ